MYTVKPVLSGHSKRRQKMIFKVRKMAKIRKRYNQVPHLTQNTTWENNKNTINITNKSQEVSLFPAGDHKAAMNRRESMKKKQEINNTNDPQKKYSLWNFTGGLKPVSRCQPPRLFKINYRLMQGKHSAIISTFIKLPFVIKIFVLSFFEWPLNTGFTVLILITFFFTY